MSEQEQQEGELESEVTSELEQAKTLAKEFIAQFTIDEIKNGEWFVHLLRQVIQTYDKNARAAYFQQKYPGLPPDDLADILISVATRYATIAGAITGAAATANQIAIIGSGAMTAALFVGTIGAEMLYLSRLQIRLVLDLATLYDLQLDPDDPEDILLVFGYALGVAPTELVGKGLQIAAGAGTKTAVKKYISKNTLKIIQDFARKLGFKILQRTILKYAIPAVSAAVGSSYNYTATRSVAKIAKTHFHNRGKVTDELRDLISRQHTYDIILPAAVMYMAQVDGKFSDAEREFYRTILSRMSFENYLQSDFKKLIASEENILNAMAQIDDIEKRQTLLDLLILMAVYDGEFADKERSFLLNAAEVLGLTVHLEEIEHKVEDYQNTASQGLVKRASEATGTAITTATQTVKRANDAARRAGGNVKGAMKKSFKRKQTPEED